MADDTICLSSDDDFQKKKPKKKLEGVEKPVEVKKHDKLEKRRFSIQLDTSEPKKRIQPTQIDESKTSDDLNRPSTSRESISETGTHGPKLVIREKRPVDSTQDGSGIFSQFLSQCLMKDRSMDMKKIVERLKRHYEQTDPDYKHSPAFINLLNKKRKSLMKDDQVFVHISDIDDEMKCRRRGTETLPHGEEENPVVDEETAEISKKNYNKIRKIEKAMEKCRKKIQEFGDAEVNWDEDENSNFMKLARYEEKMAQLYSLLCEITGDNGDIGRRYLKQKFLKVTQIEEVDKAIISFMSQKLKDKMKKMKKKLSTADCIIFPDYCDILKCIKQCNDDKKLGMESNSMEKLAEKAFRDLGNYLQKLRREDLLDGVSLMLESEVDPAQQDSELLRRLEESELRGRKRLDGVFEKWVKRQEEGPAGVNNDDDDDDENQNPSN